MKEVDFINWLKGFTQGVHHYGISPKQWDFLKQKLEEVETTPDNGSTPYSLSEAWTTTTTGV